jgi:hypothetical protein
LKLCIKQSLATEIFAEYHSLSLYASPALRMDDTDLVRETINQLDALVHRPLAAALTTNLPDSEQGLCPRMALVAHRWYDSFALYALDARGFECSKGCDSSCVVIAIN